MSSSDIMSGKYDSLISGDSMSSSTSLPSRYQSVSETFASTTTKSIAVNESMSLEMSGRENEPLLGSKKDKIPGTIQIRHQLGIFVFIGMTVVCAMRQNVSGAMVAMVNDSYISQDFSGNESWDIVATCEENKTPNSTSGSTNGGEFLWNTHTQELLLAGFLYGYIFTQIPGGWLSDKFGMKWVLGLGLFLSSICTLLGPLAANADVEWYFVTRFLSGFGEGVSFPSMLALWSKWAHPSERSSLSVIGFAGFNFGNVVGNALTGFLINLDILGGWPFPFYVFGTSGCLWFVMWCFVAYSSPGQHPWISKEEREYLEEGLNMSSNRAQTSVPWRSILVSPAMWCLVFTHFAHTMGMFTLLVNLPLYYSDGIRVPIEQAGLYSALPFALQFCVMIIFSHVSDVLIARKILSKKSTRKLMSALGFMSGALFLTLAGFSRCNIALSVTVVTLAMGGIGISFSGHFVSLLDIAGRYAGSAMGMMNTSGTLGGIIGPYIVGVFTEIQSDITGWQKVLWIIAALYVVGGLIFVIFASVELQPWARNDDKLVDRDGDVHRGSYKA